MSQFADTPDLVRLAGRDFRRSWKSILLFEAGYKLLQTWLLLPTVALALSMVMARAGRVAVTDRDILDFLLTPVGLVYAFLAGAVAAALILFEQAGLMTIAARADAVGPVPRPGIRHIARAAWRIVRLGATQFALLALTAVPFLAVLALAQALLLSRQDINYYLAERPPAFRVALAVGIAVGAAALAVACALVVRWSFALPVLLFERRSVRDTLRAGRQRVRGSGWRVASVLLVWQTATLLLAAALQTGFRVFAEALPTGAGEDPRVLVVLLVVRGTLMAAVSTASAVGPALLVRRMYLASDTLPAREPAPGERSAGPEPLRRRGAWLLRLAPVGLIAVPVAVWTGLALTPGEPRPVGVTAHRGHSHVAPENTVRAIRAAAEVGADAAEIDVQLTADGEVVVLHDRDLRRVTGDPRRIESLTWAELQKLDAGRAFGPEFAGERVPSLREAIAAAGDRLRLNIELKYYAPDRGLARAAARIVREEHFGNRCVLTSFDQSALRTVRQTDPGLRTGPIVATALGDVAGLEGDILSVRADFLTDRVLRDAHLRGREVHVWTVDDERTMDLFLARGVDDIITGRPDLLLRVRARRLAMSDTERLIFASRALLGLDRLGRD